MSALLLFLSSLLTSSPMTENTQYIGQEQRQCITEKQLSQVVGRWEMIDTDVVKKRQVTYFVISVHNILNKHNPKAVDAKLFFAIDPAMPYDPSKYSLRAIQFFNPTTVVSFRRMFIFNKTSKNMKQVFPIQTPCFQRQVIQLNTIKEST